MDWSQVDEHPHVQPAHPAAAARNLHPFPQSMVQRPLARLVVRISEPVTCDAAAMAQLARCNRLRELELNFSTLPHLSAQTWVDWSDPSFFAPFSPRCLPCLLSVRLEHVKLSADSVVALASAAPLLRDFGLSAVRLTCHPAVVCAILGGWCRCIEDIYVDDRLCHCWRTVHPADVRGAYTTAAAAAGRSGCRPFTQLRKLHTTMCWCTPPAVWHALLSLMRYAKPLRHVYSFCSNDPLTGVALKYLPCLVSLSADCELPPTFGAFVQRKLKPTGRYRYVACGELCGGVTTGHYNRRWMALELSDSERPAKGKTYDLTNFANRPHMQREREQMPSLIMRPHSGLFTRYQRSLGPKTEAVLARWAESEFDSDDDGQRAAQVALSDGTAPINHRDFGPSVTVFHWYRVKGEGTEEAVQDEEMADGDNARIKVEPEGKQE